jgi:hypothetical protein
MTPECPNGCEVKLHYSSRDSAVCPACGLIGRRLSPPPVSADQPPARSSGIGADS